MLRPENVELLRCPLDPEGPGLELVESHLVCRRCGLRFPIREGIPALLVDVAEMPEGVREVSELPCKRHGQQSEGSR
jgi:uncharacterized protein YbaR (Trm112 family)